MPVPVAGCGRGKCTAQLGQPRLGNGIKQRVLHEEANQQMMGYADAVEQGQLNHLSAPGCASALAASALLVCALAQVRRLLAARIVLADNALLVRAVRGFQSKPDA